MDFSRPKAMLVASDDPQQPWVVLAKESRTARGARAFARAPRRARIATLALAVLLAFSGSLYGAWQGTAAELAGNPTSANEPGFLPALLPGQPEPRTISAAIAGSPATPSSQTSTQTARANVPRIRIAKIGVDMPIVEGKNERVLFSGAWRSPWNSTPEQGGNTVIFGHRYLRLPPHPETFYNLDKLAVGDTFEVSWGGATYRYRVTETKVVPPNDLSVLTPTAKPIITLITCTPVFTTKNRLIVIGELL